MVPEHFIIENIYPDEMLRWREALPLNAREIGAGEGLCPPSIDCFKCKML
jgi:hypothetical protein